MRLTSDFWVAALMRKVRNQKGFAYLVRRGATEAGAIFIKVYGKAGMTELYGPAPQIFYENQASINDRRFVTILSDADEGQIAEKLERELDFDPDIWIVEIENFNKIEELITVIDEWADSSAS